MSVKLSVYKFSCFFLYLAITGSDWTWILNSILFWSVLMITFASLYWRHRTICYFWIIYLWELSQLVFFSTKKWQFSSFCWNNVVWRWLGPVMQFSDGHLLVRSRLNHKRSKNNYFAWSIKHLRKCVEIELIGPITIHLPFECRNAIWHILTKSR